MVKKGKQKTASANVGKKASERKLAGGKKYYVRLRSVKEVESKEWVSQWSTVKEVTVK